MMCDVGDEIPPWTMPRYYPSACAPWLPFLGSYPVHWDRRAVAAMGLGNRTINQGPLGLSYMINMLTRGPDMNPLSA